MSNCNDLSELVFDDITPLEVPVRIGAQRYVLRETDAENIEKYDAARMKGATMEDGVLTLPPEVGGLQTMLVSMCLVKCNQEGKPMQQVSRKEVQRFPNRILDPLFKKARAINHIDSIEDTEESLTKEIERLTRKRDRLRAKQDPAKNLPGATMDGFESSANSSLD